MESISGDWLNIEGDGLGFQFKLFLSIEGR